MNKHLLTALLLATASFASQAQNLVSNGSFNTSASRSEIITDSTVPGWKSVSTGQPHSGEYSVMYRSAEETRTTGAWTPIQDVWLQQKPPVTASPDGGSFLAIDADSDYNSKIEQTLTGLIPGKTYNLSFFYAGAQYTTRTGATTEWFDVTLGGSAPQRTAILNNASEGFTGWQTATMSFVADSSTAVLSFLAGGTPNGLPPVSLLDGVTLTAAVPEPATFASLALGLLVLGGLRLRAAHRRD